MAEGVGGATGRQAEVIDDIGIAEAYRPWRLGSVVMWELGAKARGPTLVPRGAEPGMLPGSTVEEMTRRGPNARLVEFEPVGHLPPLLAAEPIEPVTSFLERS